jgi:hypothetical protein
MVIFQICFFIRTNPRRSASGGAVAVGAGRAGRVVVEFGFGGSETRLDRPVLAPVLTLTAIEVELDQTRASLSFTSVPLSSFFVFRPDRSASGNSPDRPRVTCASQVPTRYATCRASRVVYAGLLIGWEIDEMAHAMADAACKAMQGATTSTQWITSTAEFIESPQSRPVLVAVCGAVRSLLWGSRCTATGQTGRSSSTWGHHRAPSMPRVRVLTTSSPQRCSIFRTVPLRVLTTALSYLPAPRPRARRAPPPVATSDGWAREIGREIEPTRHLAGCSRGG